MGKAIVNKTSTVAELTAESAIKFLQEENAKKIEQGNEVMKKAIEELAKMGLSLAVENVLDKDNRILNRIKIVVK